jgi:hypothetical protein
MSIQVHSALGVGKFHGMRMYQVLVFTKTQVIQVAESWIGCKRASRAFKTALRIEQRGQ